MNPVRVWIARTEPGAQRLAAALAERGIAAFKAPVLNIAPCPSMAPEGRFDFVLFVSEHAIANAARFGWLNADWLNCPSAAIGAVGDSALRRHGVVPCMAPPRSAAAVIDRLDIPPPKTLIVKGEGGSDALQGWLREHGGTVVEWNVYRRLPARPCIAGEHIDAVVVGSGEGMREVARLWRDAGRDPTLPVLAPSERVADMARGLGFLQTVATHGANADAVVTALECLGVPNGGRAGARHLAQEQA